MVRKHRTLLQIRQATKPGVKERKIKATCRAIQVEEKGRTEVGGRIAALPSSVQTHRNGAKGGEMLVTLKPDLLYRRPSLLAREDLEVEDGGRQRIFSRPKQSYNQKPRNDKCE